MEPQQTPGPVTGIGDEKVLAQFVAEHRQKLPDTAQPAPFDALVERMKAKTVETPEQTAAREASESRQVLRQEQARRQGELAKLIQSAGNRYADCTLDTFNVTSARQQKVVAAIADYIDLLRDAWESTGLVLYGPVGTGKDHLAIAVARVAVEQIGKRVAWVNGQDLFGQIRDNIDKGSPEAGLIRHYAGPDLLVLSDPLPPAMGKGDELTMYQASMLYRLIDARYSRGQVTIVTLNVNDDDEADRRIGTPTWDRINHGAWKVHCDWASYRKPAREI